ncbi:MAG: C13 family peptidase, partial [Desulfobacteraceae bacterium]
YDTVLMYKMLRENGFKGKNIFVLYGDGIDFDTGYAEYNSNDQFGHPITDYPNHKNNIQNIFSWLANGNSSENIIKVKKNDYLFVWSMGHGLGYGPTGCNLSMEITNTAETVTDTEFASYINSIAAYKKRNVAIMTCHAGGMIDNLDMAGSKTVTHTSSTCLESSYEGNGTYDVNHAEFTYQFANALREQTPDGTTVNSDTDNNGAISLREAHDYTNSNMVTSSPREADPDGISSSTYIKKKTP